MNTQNLTKVVLAGVATASLAFISSCTTLDPEYAAYKKQQAATKAQAANPYGVATIPDAAVPNATINNPYSVPRANGETGAPYQAIPGVTNTPTPPVIQNIQPQASPEAYIPLPAEPSVNASTHTVIKNDTIWGLSRKFGVTEDQIREANNLTTDTIWVGQRLIIPAR